MGCSSVDSVLNGTYPQDAVQRMDTVRLEKLVRNLVEKTSQPNGKERIRDKSYKRPKWWPKTLTFTQPIKELRLISNNLNSWHMMLAQLVQVCSIFYNRNPSSSRKRVAEDEVQVEADTKRIKIDTVGRNKENVIKTNYPIVKLHDILRPYKKRIVSKEEFMSTFHLKPKHSSFNPQTNTFKRAAVRVTSLPQVPISSDYGQQLLKRDNNGSCNESYVARKLERLEWNMLDRDTPSRDQPLKVELTYGGKQVLDHAHVYKFPRRQAYQMNGEGYSTEFLKSLCRPLKVDVERLVVKGCKVVLPRLSLGDVKVIKQPVVVLERKKLKKRL